MTKTHSAVFSPLSILSMLGAAAVAVGTALMNADCTIRAALAQGLVAAGGAVGTSYAVLRAARPPAAEAPPAEPSGYLSGKIVPIFLAFALCFGLSSCQGTLPKQALAFNQQMNVAVDGVLDVAVEMAQAEPDPAKRADKLQRIAKYRALFKIASASLGALIVSAIEADPPASKPSLLPSP